MRSQSPPGPIKGSVLHNCVITGGQQACHTDEDRDTYTYIVFRNTLTNIYQHRNDITAPQTIYTVSFQYRASIMFKPIITLGSLVSEG